MANLSASVEKIGRLRQEAASLLINSNAIVDEIWKLDSSIVTAAASEKQKLIKEKELLEKVLAKENYATKIKEIKEQIYELEMKEYGASDILKGSPASGNILL